MPVVIYVHGFLSSSKARKAVLTSEFISNNNVPVSFESYDFSDDPLEALRELEKIVCKHIQNGESVFLIGSSLGGFLSLCISTKYNIKAVLINPCVNPWDIIPNIQGSLTNPYTNHKFNVSSSCAYEIKKIFDGLSINQSLLALYVQRGDEVLNYKIACGLLSDAALIHIEDGGSHTFANYSVCLPEIFRFLQ